MGVGGGGGRGEHEHAGSLLHLGVFHAGVSSAHLSTCGFAVQETHV